MSKKFIFTVLVVALLAVTLSACGGNCNDAVSCGTDANQKGTNAVDQFNRAVDNAQKQWDTNVQPVVNQVKDVAVQPVATDVHEKIMDAVEDQLNEADQVIMDK